MTKTSTHIIATSIIAIVFLFSLTYLKSQNTSAFPSYINSRFSVTPTINYCYYQQTTSNSCIRASVQMVLDYIDTSPLPNQTELAIEMHTTENQTAQWKYTYLPFEKRGFNDYFNGSLPNNFETALNLLKGNVSRNYPTIVDTWFDEQAKENNTITHARVIIGYNTTGVFFHDPWSGPNQFMNNQEFEDLWNTTEGYYIFMLEQEPLFNLTAKRLTGLAIQFQTLISL